VQSILPNLGAAGNTLTLKKIKVLPFLRNFMMSHFEFVDKVLIIPLNWRERLGIAWG
jgi:hypothetical protein